MTFTYDKLDSRNVTVGDVRTTVALEPYYWRALEEISKAQHLSFESLLHEIDSKRGKVSRASAIRVYVTDFFRMEVQIATALAPKPRRASFGEATESAVGPARPLTIFQDNRDRQRTESEVDPVRWTEIRVS